MRFTTALSSAESKALSNAYRNTRIMNVLRSVTAPPPARRVQIASSVGDL